MTIKGYPKPKHYQPINPNKYVGKIENIQLRSSWERRFAHYVDVRDDVIKWGSESLPIPYYSRIDGRVRRYFVDFFIVYRKEDGSTTKAMIEIKPYKQTVAPRQSKNKKRYMEDYETWIRNQDKWKAAKAFGEQNGFDFIILTEKELGIK